jgi:hypothetical protein
MLRTSLVDIPRLGSSTLASLLSYENPRLTDYQRIAGESISALLAKGRRDVGEAFSQHWYKRSDADFSHRMTFEQMREGVKDRAHQLLGAHLKDELLLIDLGGRHHTMAALANCLQVRNLITVDINVHEGFSERRSSDSYFTKSFSEFTLSPPTTTRLMSSPADMLYFIAQLPSRSCSISINGIDKYIVTADYAQALATEIERVVRVGGVVFGECSLPLNPHKGMIKSLDFERLSSSDAWGIGCDVLVRRR